MKAIVTSLIVLISSTVGYTQSLSKKAIREELLKNESAKNSNSTLHNLIDSDASLNVNAKKVVADLIALKVDTLSFFKIVSSGFIASDSCFKGKSPYHFLLFWKYQGKYYIQQFTQNSQSQQLQVDSIWSIKFFERHFYTLQKEQILPVIYGAQKDGSRIKFDGSIEMHENKYSIYAQVRKDMKYVAFGQSDIEDEKSLFHMDNISTELFHWIKIIKAEADTFKPLLSIQ